jgi:hypothetical protein
MKSVTFRRIWVLLGAALLLGVGQFAAAPAQAQTCDEEQEVVWELVEALGYAIVQIDQAFNSNPSTRDCDNICRKLESGCKKAGRGFGREVNTLIRTALSAAAVLCKTAPDKRACKADISAGRKAARMLMREFRDDFDGICGSQALDATCSDACNENDLPMCCEEAFGGTCIT